jgi:hypothetical protein
LTLTMSHLWQPSNGYKVYNRPYYFLFDQLLLCPIISLSIKYSEISPQNLYVFLLIFSQIVGTILFIFMFQYMNSDNDYISKNCLVKDFIWGSNFPNHFISYA